MLLRRRLGLAALVLAACAPSAQTASPTPVPPAPPPAQATPPAPPPAASPPPAAAPAVREAPEDWQLLDATADGFIGTGVARAYRELLAGREPARTVVVAVIDGGVDTAHVDLRDNLWRNEDEIAGNGVDDDRNGYIDDVYGWNFLGNPSGDDVHWDTFEVTRLHVICTRGEALPQGVDAGCGEIADAYEEKRNEAQQVLGQVRQIRANLQVALPMLEGALGGQPVTLANVQALQPTQANVRQARDFYLALAGAGISPADVEDAAEAYQTQLDYNLNTEFDPRPSVGDDYSDPAERDYGNPDVTGPDAKHGTHVAGIIGAMRGNGVGIEGITSAVRIMAVRAVPDGDERDKDVANAIRYAVDNGASIINMSFGKSYSPTKSVVDEAVRYADERGVLLIHAAGNDGADLEQTPNFPNREFTAGGTASNWIEVGASAWQGADSLAAPFSNYGRTRVDLFAPGVDILSTVPGDEFSRQDGTSMAAPVVTGVAALLMAYFPDLSAADVKRLLIESATRYTDQSVLQPGGQTAVPFGSLSSTGGVVNAYEAIRRAQRGVSDR